ncbi:uncharacterized protein LOC125500365 [Athalia rosae]|uniref:uncharacterized protein LOC125500365 n=1 Tax=Athalia rosae TaxID=37344 RepID=UPI0020344A7F|nr:uncharacterized protein LOC125500365 [Athalia rosae]
MFHLPLTKIVYQGSVKNENLKPIVRHAAIYCLAELLFSDRRNCFNLFQIEGQVIAHYIANRYVSMSWYVDTLLQIHLLRMIKKPTENISVEMQVTALQCLRAIGSYPDFREKIISAEFIDVLCTPIAPDTNSSLAECKVNCCDVLSIYCVEKEAREFFSRIDGPQKLYNLLLDSEPVPVRNAAARLMMQLCSDQVMAAQLILSGSLE